MDLFDFNGDGKVDLGEEFMVYQIYQDVTGSGSSGGGYLQGSSNDRITNAIVMVLLIAIVLLPFIILGILVETNETLAFWYTLILAAVFYGWVIKVNVEKSREKKREQEYEARAAEIVDQETFSEEEIAEHAKLWAAMNSHDWKFVYKKDLNACRERVVADYRKHRIWRVMDQLKAEDQALKKSAGRK